MFRRLRLKLTVLYAGLFCTALILIGATAYAVVTDTTRRLAEDQLRVTATMYERAGALRSGQLREGARALSLDPAFAGALASRDGREIGMALSTLRGRLRADRAFVITAEGLVIDEGGAGASSVAPGLQAVLARDEAPIGVFSTDGAIERAVITPIGGAGWVVLTDVLDAGAMEWLEAQAPAALDVAVVTRSSSGAWGAAELPAEDELTALVERARAAERPYAVAEIDGERVMGAVSELRSLDGTPSVLLMRYQLSGALSPYRTLFSTLIMIGVAGLALLVVGTWLLAQSITQPLSTLEAAARSLREGVYEPVVVRTKDEIARVAASFNAMIEAIRERERRITQLAFHDAETRLPNRLALERKLAAAQRQDHLFLAAIGVDRFADVRSAIGYTHAGALIRHLGARLARLAPNGPMARLSSDVLAIGFQAANEDDARRRADALVAHLEQPLKLDGHVVDVNVSIGIAQPRDKDETPAAMIQRASIALEQTRTARAKAQFFDKAAYGDPARNLSLMGEMRQALENGEMGLVHQPKYNFRTGRIDSAETLVRWKHPTRGFISPDVFVPMAEETGHVRALTDWVMARALIERAQLAQAGWPLDLSVNISGRLLSDPDFAEAALEAARDTEQPLNFEITETAVIDNPKLALENIKRFAAARIRIAIDDYGSGLSSLAYLKQMPAHELKIDKMFVQNITADPRDALLVRSTIDLAHGLGLEVTAEGVETPAAFALLASMGCDLAQGYLVSRPATVAELLPLLNDSKRLAFYQQTAAAGAAVESAPARERQKLG